MRSARFAMFSLPVVLVAAVVAASMFSGVSCSGAGKPVPTAAPFFPGSTQIAAAQASAASGHFDEAAESLLNALLAFEEKEPLRIRHLVIVDGPVRGYGLYNPLPSDTVKIGEPLRLYLEPAGMSHHKNEQGTWETKIDADLAIITPDGVVVQEQKDFLQSSFVSHEPNRELQFVLELATKGMQENDFVAKVTIHDRIGNKEAFAAVPFLLRIPQK
jgi:hypothetical protein